MIKSNKFFEMLMSDFYFMQEEILCTIDNNDDVYKVEKWCPFSSDLLRNS